MPERLAPLSGLLAGRPQPRITQGCQLGRTSQDRLADLLAPRRASRFSHEWVLGHRGGRQAPSCAKCVVVHTILNVEWQRKPGIMNRILTSAIAGFVFVGSASHGQAQDCEPLRPSRTTDSLVQNVTEAQANVLLKSLGSGTFKNQYLKMQSEQKFNDPDEANRWSSFIYGTCSILSQSNLPTKEKLENWERLNRFAREKSPLLDQVPTAPGPMISSSPRVITLNNVDFDFQSAVLSRNGGSYLALRATISARNNNSSNVAVFLHDDGTSASTDTGINFIRSLATASGIKVCRHSSSDCIKQEDSYFVFILPHQTTSMILNFSLGVGSLTKQQLQAASSLDLSTVLYMRASDRSEGYVPLSVTNAPLRNFVDAK